MERISKCEFITGHQRDYIAECKLTAAMLDHWCHHKHDEDQLTTEVIRTWKSTCDKLIQNPHFSTGWDLPAFYLLYSYQCMAGMRDFFASSQNL
jgi:hypothetical protein